MLLLKSCGQIKKDLGAYLGNLIEDVENTGILRQYDDAPYPAEVDHASQLVTNKSCTVEILVEDGKQYLLFKT